MIFKNLISIIFLSVGFLISSPVGAQTINPDINQQQQDIEVSDAELKQFLDISKEIQMLQYDIQNTLVQLIKESSMTLERFKEISGKQQQGQQPNLTQEEEQVLSSLQQEMAKEQQTMKTKMDSILDEHAMKQSRYITISRALQGDAELQNRLRELQQGEEK